MLVCCFGECCVVCFAYLVFVLLFDVYLVVVWFVSLLFMVLDLQFICNCCFVFVLIYWLG